MTDTATQPLAAQSDPGLLAVYLDRSAPDAFAHLVQKHAPMVLAVCRSVLHNPADAEDAAQAVFLTLAQKAPTLRNLSTLAGWLHRVAWFIATRAARAAAIRDRHEREAARMLSETIPSEPPIAPEILHAELARLPEKYRLPLLLHHLEGQTQEQTAATLGCTPAAASVRLTRARQMLRNRLVRRGIAASAVGLVAALTAQSPAAVPSFIHTASQTALAVLSGHSTAATPTVAALSKGAINMLYWTKLKTAALLAAAVLFAGGLGVATLVLAAPQTTTKPAATSPDDARNAKLVAAANEEAKKAFRKQAGLADDADVGDFSNPGNSTYNLVSENVVTPAKDKGWQVTMTKKVPSNGDLRLVVRAIVNLDKDGKLSGDVKFEGPAQPVRRPAKGNP